MIPRRRATLSAILLLAVALGSFLSFRARPHIPHSSPTAIRTNEAYARAHSPAAKLPPIGEDIFSSIVVERAGEQLSITCLSDPLVDDLDYGFVTVHKAEATQPIPVGNGSIRLAYLGTVTDISRAKPGGGASIPTTYYTPDLKPLADLASLPLPSYSRDMRPFRLPSAQFVFACSNIADFKPLRVRAFDARTRYPLSRGRYDGGYFLPSTNGFTYGTPLNLWHQTPIELVTTMAIGPARIYSLPPTEGAELKLPDAAFKLLFADDVEFEDYSTDTDGRTNSASLRAIPSPKSEGLPKRFSLVFYSGPRSDRLPFDFEFYNSSGERMVANTASLGDRFTKAEILGSLAELKEIRLKHYPNLHRLVFILPELPGLPEENRNLKDLFDLHIPYIRITMPQLLPVTLGNLVQMQPRNVGFPEIPRSKFQTERTNTTPRALFQEISAHMKDDDQLVADPEKNELRTERPPLQNALNTVKRFFSF